MQRPALISCHLTALPLIYFRCLTSCQLRAHGCDGGNAQIERYNSEVFAFLPDFGYIIGGEDFQSSPDFARENFSTTTCVQLPLAEFSCCLMLPASPVSSAHVLSPLLGDLPTFGLVRRTGFQELCCECYLVVRKQANLFINLFSLLLPTGLYKEEELSVVCRATPSKLVERFVLYVNG